MPTVAIVYLTWSHEPEEFLHRALKGIAKQSYPKEKTRLFIVYNSHAQNEESSLPYVERAVALFKDKLPRTNIIALPKNVGFTGGNNAGLRAALDGGAQYIFLHNADGFLADEAIQKQVQVMENDNSIGQTQCLVLLYPEQDLINTTGNSRHYLGFGFCANYRKPSSTLPNTGVKDIGYASGAATMLRADTVTKYGFLNEELFLYHEDTEFSLRLRSRGLRVVSVGDAIFYHEYTFNKSTEKYYWLERNRHVVTYLYYRWPTLLLLAPLEIAYNVALIFVAARSGWLMQLLKSYAYWLKSSSWHGWGELRRRYQNERKISDRELILNSSKTLDTGELVVPKPVALAANVLFTFYYYLLILVVRW